MKNKLQIAIGAKRPKDLSKTHYTTMSFGQIIPTYHHTVIPGQKLIVKPSLYARTAPLFLPTLSSLRIVNNAFYCPYRFVWRHFENFINGLPSYVNGEPVVFKKSPFIRYEHFTDIMLHANVAEQTPFVEEVTNDGNFDICLTVRTEGGDPTYKFFRYTNRGRFVLHIFNSLGYNFNIISRYDAVTQSDIGEFKFREINMLPLLAFFKCYLDYYVPSQLQPTNPISAFLDLVNNISDSEVEISAYDKPDLMTAFMKCFDYLYQYYPNNYFTSSWLYPNAPAQGLNNFDSGLINSISSQVEDAEHSDINQPVASTNNGVESINSRMGETISQDGLSFLQKFNRFIKRNMYAGTRAVERLKARFGISVDDFELGMSKYYGSQIMDMQKGAVQSTQGSDGSLGEYAGNAWVETRNNKTFRFDCDLHGHVFIISHVEVPSTYVDGFRRDNLSVTPLDFYNPEFDGTILQATSGHELFGRFPIGDNFYLHTLFNKGLLTQNVYGYISRFAHLKTDIDDVTGDFTLPRLNTEIDGFVLPRRVLDINSLMAYVREHQTLPPDTSAVVGSGLLQYFYQYFAGKINPLVSLESSDSQQFNRIFKDIFGNEDPFFCRFTFDVVSLDGMLPLDSTNEIKGRGKVMEFESNGVHI